MKTSALLLASTALFGLTVAQQATLPACAGDCVTRYTTGTEIGGCGQFDVKCICENQDFLSNIACCLQDRCGQEDQSQAVLFARQMCVTSGVDVPDEVTCNGNTSSNSTDSTATTASPPTDSDTDSNSDSNSNTDSDTNAPPSAATYVKGTSVFGILGMVAAMAFL